MVHICHLSDVNLFLWLGTKDEVAEQFCGTIKAFGLLNISLAPSHHGFWLPSFVGSSLQLISTLVF